MCLDCAACGISEKEIGIFASVAWRALIERFPDPLYKAATEYIMAHPQLTLVQLDACFRRHDIPCYLYGEKRTEENCPGKLMKIDWHDGTPREYSLRFACGVPVRSIAVRQFSPHLRGEIGENDAILAKTGFTRVRQQAKEEVKAMIKRNENEATGFTPLRDNTVYFANTDK